MGTQSARREVGSLGGPIGAARKLLTALALNALVWMPLGIAAAQQVRGLDPLPTFTPGRHVYDYGDMLTPQAEARAEAFATSIENAGGGLVVVYTDVSGQYTNANDLATAWKVDGLLLTGEGDLGHTKLGATLTGRLSSEAGKFIEQYSSGFEKVQDWSLSVLACADGLLRGQHVFDGPGVLDAAGLQTAETAAVNLGQKLGAKVYVEIAGSKDDPESTAFFDAAEMSSAFKRTLVIALGISNGRIGGNIDSDSDLWDAYNTGSPWSNDVLSNEDAPGGDVQAAVLQAIDAVSTPPNPVEAGASLIGWVRDSVTGFFSDRTNDLASLAGFLASLGLLVLFRLDRRRRRREGGFADDDSVLLPAPPAEMTPALASIVAAPLNTTRAITVALLDLAAHGRIAFYDSSDPFGSGGGIRVVGETGSGGLAGGAHESAALAGMAGSRALGPAEESLLGGLRSHAAVSGDTLGFGELRPLFEQTAEQLEQIARERGWLNLQSGSASVVWTAVGGALLLAAGVSVYFFQPIAVVCLGLAGLTILPGSRRMPLPLRTANGVMTTAMVEAYRRTLRRALAGAPGTMPPWLANAEEAALWGYAWGLEGEVQAFVGHNVSAAMFGAAAPQAGDMASISLLLQGVTGVGNAKPVGLDTDAIASTLGGLGRNMVIHTDDKADG